MKLENIKAFMAHIPEDEFDYLEEVLLEYNVVKYLIAHETTPYQHFHFVVEFENEPDKHYHNFSKRVFKDKYKLNGQAKAGKARQYGCLKKIENLEKMCAYTLKDGNFRTNMEQTDIEKYIKISSETTKYKTFREKLLEHLQTKKFTNKVPNYDYFLNHTEEESLEKKVKKEVIHYFIENQETNIKLSKSFIENIYIEYLLKDKTLSLDEKKDAIYCKFFSIY